ncbi:GNAT family N-acetyltransferase [Candidatus Woesearchaeota archaeon]|nr:GNAT family N-acetyltransferase [Candidatus Woesearchaeota archaeon]
MDNLNYFHPAVRGEVSKDSLADLLCANKQDVYLDGELRVWSNEIVVKNGTRIIYGLDLDGKASGGAFLRGINPDWNHIAGMLISEDFRGKGLGSLLIQTYLRDLSKDFIDTTLETQANNKKAIEFYKRNNFEMFKEDLNIRYASARKKKFLSVYESVILWEGDCDPKHRTNVVFGHKNEEKEEYSFTNS